MHKFSVKTQFMSIVIVLLCCLIALSIAAYNSFKNLLQEKNHSYAQNSSLTYTYSMNDLLLRITNISGVLLQSEEVTTFITESMGADTYRRVNALSSLFTTYQVTHSDLADLSIISNEMRYSLRYSEATLNELWRQTGTGRGVRCLGMVDKQLWNANEIAKPYLVFGCNVYTNGSEPAGCLFLSVDLLGSPISNAINAGAEHRSVSYFLSDPSFSLYPLNTDGETVSLITQDIQAHAELFEGIGTLSQNVRTEAYDYTCMFVPGSNFRIISAIDLSAMTEDMDGTRGYLMLIIALFCALLILAGYVLLRNVVLPLRTFHAHMHSIHQGQRREMRKPLTLTGCRELHELGNEFNGMLEEILRLEEQLVQTIRNLYEADIERQKAEIAHLRSQINPHFLYNTLESIKGLACEHNAPEIADAASAMGKIFRYSIKGASTVPLSQEMEIAQAYIQIQKMRFGSRLEAFFSIPEACRKLQVPKMLLQPLTENAVVHGLENRLEGGTVYISARQEGETLLISVMDDGKGIVPEQLAEVQRILTSPDPATQKLGLANIHQRIRLSCGSEYGLSIESSPGKGTKITVRLPVQLEHPGEEEAYVQGSHCG